MAFTESSTPFTELVTSSDLRPSLIVFTDSDISVGCGWFLMVSLIAFTDSDISLDLRVSPIAFTDSDISVGFGWF